MYKHILLILLFLLIPLLLPLTTFAQQANKSEFLKAKVIKIIDQGQTKVGPISNIFQKVEITVLDGSDKDKTLTIEHGGMFSITDAQKVKLADTVILHKTVNNGKTEYRIYDKYRLNNLVYILAGFFIMIFLVAGIKKGFGSIIGMLISLAVIMWFIIPQILNGVNPLAISLIGSLFIMVITIYLAHGFSQQTTIAISATFLSLVLTVIFSLLFVKFIQLSGTGSEDIYSLQQGFAGRINFQGLLLGSIIIGVLGVLDDVTTTQTTTIFTLATANPKFNMKDLFTHGMIIGREHIASLVNTLVLAYAGASIGVFIYLLLGMKNASQPLWVMLNSELIIEEVVRTVTGSLGLVLAVPITTLLASFFAKHEIRIK